MSKKICKTCLMPKASELFTKNKHCADGLDWNCKKCNAAKMRKYNKANPRHSKNQNLKKNYGITLVQFEAMLAAQGGVCKICKGPACGKGLNYHVDHNHKTGKIRGLLCHFCNIGLGHFKEDPFLLLKVIRYLEEN